MNAYIRLCRLNRPVGIVLLMLPCWWGITLASSDQFLNLKFLVLFSLGAILMRGAGCTLNDLIDKNIDSKVTRTQNRPLAKGELSTFQALVFFGIQSLGGLIILLLLPQRCWPLGLLGLGLLGIYPFMKRFTYWPQLVLGFAFNFGIIMAAVALQPYEAINWPAVVCLYGAGIAWTIGYDTIYALQDREDDLKIGVKSTAILFGNRVKEALLIVYGLMFGLLAGVGYYTSVNTLYYGLLALCAFGIAMPLSRLNAKDPQACLKVFNANPYLGWLVWVLLLILKN
ncbi:MAG: 4-hydroxybenzoate polyprenyltransferase [Alphaproteobacteria bacterium]|nr:4-hydroxybenzoate polyprenyltransferase [Alphaproteobacteria bacterium]